MMGLIRGSFMAATPYPLPKSTRQTATLLGTGVDTYGPFGTGWGIFEIADVLVETRPVGGTTWVPAAVTVAKVNPAAAYGPFTIKFSAAIATTMQYRVTGKRQHERSVAVSRGGSIDGVALEKELSKVAVVLQEQRRDIGGLGQADIFMAALIAANGANLESRMTSIEVGTNLSMPNDWSPLLDYKAGQSVMRLGTLYTALVNNSNSDPVGSANWRRLFGFFGQSLTEKLTGKNVTAAGAAVNLGAFLSAPNVFADNDIWATLTDLWVRIGGVSKKIMTGNGAMPSGTMINPVRAFDATPRTFTGALSLLVNGTSAPLITEGRQLLTLNYTPNAIADLLEVEIDIQIGKTAAGFFSVAVFDNNTCIGATYQYASANFDQRSVSMKIPPYQALSLAPRVFSVRIGQPVTTETITTCGNTAVPFGGSAHHSSLIVREQVA
jgi:hypothetical protein